MTGSYRRRLVRRAAERRKPTLDDAVNYVGKAR